MPKCGFYSPFCIFQLIMQPALNNISSFPYIVFLEKGFKSIKQDDILF